MAEVTGTDSYACHPVDIHVSHNANAACKMLSSHSMMTSQIQYICMQERPRYAEGTNDILRQYIDGKPIDEKYIVTFVSLFNETLLIWTASYTVMWGPGP